MINTEDSCVHWFYLCLALLVLFIILFVVFMVIISNYYLKVNKKSVELGHQSKDLDNKHNLNLQRIENLEKKNGKELAEIEKLNKKIETLEEVITKLIKS